MRKLHHRKWWWAAPLSILLAMGLMPAITQASTTINSNEGLSLSAGQLSVGSVVSGTLTGVINSSIQGTYPQATWSDTTGSGAGWTGSIAVSSAIYTGDWVVLGAGTSLGSTSAGAYTGTADGLLITVTVASGGTNSSTPYTWTDNQGGSGSGTATNGTPVVVEYGVTIDFASGVVYTAGDQYQVQVGAQSASALELLSAAGVVSPASGVESPAPALINNQAAVVAGGAVFGTSVPFVSAAQQQGMGSYLVSPGVDVVVDASSWAATYVSQVQYTIASGPGSSTSSGPVGTQSAGPVTTMSYTGSPQTYTVPSGVTLLQVTAQGAQGGQSGGYGGEVTTDISVTAGQVLWAYIGQQPTSPTTGGGVSGAPGGFGQGGASSNADASVLMGAGGGATSVFLTSSSSSPPSAPTSSNTGSLVEVAGAGGGTVLSSVGGAGGNPGLGAYVSPPGGPTIGGGGGATQTAGGSGTLPGSFGLGGSTQPSTDSYPGGGGGGGFYGGGAGVGFSGTPGGGGGGGSSWAEPGALWVSYTTGINAGNGSVEFQPVGALPPSSLTATYNTTTGAVALSWVASTSTNVTGYIVYRDGTQIATISGTQTTTYTDTSAPQGQTITYSVVATTAGLPSSSISTSVFTGSYYTAALSYHPAVMWELASGTGKARDLSGNGVTGTYYGGTAAAAPVNQSVGGSTTLNGTTGYIVATSPVSIGGDYTIAGWVNIAAYPTNTGGDPEPFATFGYYGYSGFGVRGDGHLTEISDNVSWNETSVTIPLNTWEFVAMTMTASGAFTIYLNGSPVASGNPGVGSGKSIAVGGDTERYLNGTVAGFAFFPSVLSSTQISGLYSAGE